MKDALAVLQTLQGTPLPNLLVIAGLLLVFLGFAGRIGAFIELTPPRQKIAGFFGFILLIFGVGLFTIPRPPEASEIVPSPTQLVNTQVIPTSPPSSTVEIPKPPPASNTPPPPASDTPPPTAYYTYEVNYGSPIEIRGGGGDGGEEMYISCPTGYIATGLVGGSGAYIDRIGLQCSWLEPNGAAGDISITEMRGGGGGSEFSIVCPAGQFLITVTGGAGVYVDRVGGHCESIDGSHSFDSASTGGSGGDPFSAQCPAGYVVTAIHGRSGELVDQVNFVCNKIDKIRH